MSFGDFIGSCAELFRIFHPLFLNIFAVFHPWISNIFSHFPQLSSCFLFFPQFISFSLISTHFPHFYSILLNFSSCNHWSNLHWWKNFHSRRENWTWRKITSLWHLVLLSLSTICDWVKGRSKSKRISLNQNEYGGLSQQRPGLKPKPTAASNKENYRFGKNIIVTFN